MRSRKGARVASAMARHASRVSRAKPPAAQVAASNRAASLAGRTSKKAAACITAALEDKPDYAWMLDLSRAEK